MTPEDITKLQYASRAADFISVAPDPKKPVEGLMMINWTIWNPIDNHKDALELSMKLANEGKIRIQVKDIYLDIYENWEGVWAPHSYILNVGDPAKIFCKAITNVAAEIGRKLIEKKK